METGENGTLGMNKPIKEEFVCVLRGISKMIGGNNSSSFEILSQFQEVLDLLSLSENSEEIVELLLENSEIFKDVFIKMQISLVKSNILDLFDQNFSQLLSIFEKILGNPGTDLLINLLLLLLIEHGLFFYRQAEAMFDFISKYIEAKQSLGEICIIPIIFCKDILKQDFVADAKWLEIWEKLTKMMDIDEISAQLMICIRNLDVNSDFLPLFKFLELCNQKYQEIVAGLAKHEIINCLLQFIEKRQILKMQQNDLISCVSETIKFPQNLYKQVKLLILCTNACLKCDKNFRVNSFSCISYGVLTENAEDFSEFVTSLANETDIRVASSILNSFKGTLPQFAQSKFLERNIILTLSTMLFITFKNCPQAKVEKFWIDIFRFFHIFNNPDVLLKNKNFKEIVFELRKDLYKSHRVKIITESFRYIYDLYTRNNEFFWVILEFLSCPFVFNSHLRDQLEVLNEFKLNTHRFKHISKIEEVILYHMLDINEASWLVYSKIFSKCLKVKISCKIIKKFSEVLNRSKSKMIIKLLEALRKSLNAEQPLDNIIREFDYFYQDCYFEVSNNEGLVMCKGEFGVVVWFKPSKKCGDCCLVEICDNGSIRFSVKIKGSKVFVKGITNKTVFEAESQDEVTNQHWNFLVVSVNFKNKSEVCIGLNLKKSKTVFQSKIGFEANFSACFLGSTKEKFENFTGKISSFQIYRRPLTSPEEEDLFFHPKLSPICTVIKKESSKIMKLKTDLLLLYPGNLSEPVVSGKPNFFFRTLKVVKCIGNSLYNALKCITGIDGIKSYGLEDFLEFLEILSILARLSDITDIVPNYFAELITFKATMFSISPILKKKYLQMILNMNSESLSKKLLFYYLNETSLHYFKDPSSVEDADRFVQFFKKLYKTDSNYFLFLAKACSGMELMNIRYVLRHYLEDFSNRVTISQILKMLIKSEEFVFIESIISLIECCDFEGTCEEFLYLLLMMLVHPLTIPFQGSLTKMIYKEINSKFEKSTRKVERICLEALGFVKERFIGIDALVECLTHFGLKSTLFHIELKQNFLDIVLLKTRYVQNLQTFNKLLKFLSENQECVYSFVCCRNIFPYWLCELHKKQPMQSLAIAEILFSHLAEFEDLSKIDYFFRNIKPSIEVLELYETIFNKFTAIMSCRHSEKLAELVMLLEIFHPKEVSCKRFCDLISRVLDLYAYNYFLNVTPVLVNEISALASRHALRIILKVSLRVLQINTDSYPCLEKLLLITNYFKSIRPQDDDKTLVESTLCLYTFCVLSEIIYSKGGNISVFFEDFFTKTEIKSKLFRFFDSLTITDIKKITESIQNCKFESGAKHYVNQAHNKFVVLNPETFTKLILDIKDSSLISQICSSDWIIHIHYVLITRILLPLKQIKYSQKLIQPKDAEIDSSSPVLQKFEEIFTNLNTEDFILEKEMKKTYLKTIHSNFTKEQNRKLESIESILEGKFFIKNRVDQCYRCFILKLTDKVFEVDEKTSSLCRESIRKSVTLPDFDSRMFSSVIANPIEKSVLLSNNPNFVRLECEQIKISGSFFGIVTFTDKFFELKFVRKVKNADQHPGSALAYTVRTKKRHYVFSIEQVSEVLARRFIHKNSAVEIFLCSGKTFFLNLFRKSCREQVFGVVSRWEKVKVFKGIPFEEIQMAREMWSTGSMTNFEYLLVVNKYAGRSFNDLSQYPVFPWVLKNYSEEKLNPEDKDIYRDFSYSIGAQTPEKRSDLKKTRRINIDEYGKYHYGQHYSNGGIVLYYLFRLEPFTTQNKLLQEGKFDHPDRIFFSMDCSWECSQINAGDNKELIPELFYLPQALENLNSLFAGKNTRFGTNSAEFNLPRWAINAWDFVRKHKKCLESAYCSANIHNWIDLVFGFKQSGDAAEAALNLFHPISYQEAYKSIAKVLDPSIESCIIDQIYHFGQTPQRVFKEPHPKRKFVPVPSIYECWKSEFGVTNKSIGFSKLGDFLDIMADHKFLFVFYLSGKEIKFSRLNISEKFSGKSEEFTLKQIKTFDFFQIRLTLWGEFIVSVGYHDCSIRFSENKGELKFILNIHPTPILSISANEKLYTGSQVLFGWSFKITKHQQFVGHKAQIISICASDCLKIIVSCDAVGNILVHDTRTAEYITSVKLAGKKVLISELGFFVVVCSGFFSYFSFDGRVLGKASVECGELCCVNRFGDLMMMVCKEKIVCCDVLEGKGFEVGITGFVGFCVSKDEKAVFGVNMAKDSMRVEVFVQNVKKKV